MKLKFLNMLVMLFVLASLTDCKKEKDDNTPAPTTNLDIYRAKSLAEMNFLRSDPAGYAEARLKSYFDAGTDNGAYNDIKSRSAAGPLVLQAQLNSSAHKYAVVLFSNQGLSHYFNGTTPSSRAQAEGYASWSGENIAYHTSSTCNIDVNPETAAIEHIRQFVIDMGVVDLGHRNNCMNSLHKSVGFGFYYGDNRNYWVEDFGSQP
ncbi:MAG: CAP domain-containing protein [Bacteroidia bacterium]|nr:CAP domain-containing protein [Bacteroidia bacterium]